MKVTLGSNIASLKALGALDDATRRVDKASTRLASGQRIVSASDDAAGLSIASRLNADVRVVRPGIRNISDAQSVLSIADQALGELSQIVERVTELATQAASAVYSSEQREALDSETQSLIAEYRRIVSVTEFNGEKLFSGAYASRSIQAGTDTRQISIPGSLDSLFVASVTEVHGTGQVTLSGSMGEQGVGNTGNVLLADFNEDGILDYWATGVNQNFVISLGNGDGTFDAATYTSAAASSYIGGARAADINNDGNVDIIQAGSYWLGNGDGSFQAEISFSIGYGANDLKVVDIDGDNNLDLLFNDGGPGVLLVALGNGNGTFETAVSYTSVGASREMALGDINGDGNLDVILGQGNGGSFVGVQLGDGNGGFGAVIGDGANPLNPEGITVGDFNGDGKLDLITGSSVFSIRLGNGDGTFGTSTTFAATLGDPFNLSTFDFDGDGNFDLVADAIYLGNGDGTFQAGVSAGQGGRGYDIGDLNGDGILDVLEA